MIANVSRQVDIPPDPKKIITKGFSTVFYPTGYSEEPSEVKSIKIYQNLTHKSPKIQDGRHWPQKSVKPS